MLACLSADAHYGEIAKSKYDKEQNVGHGMELLSCYSLQHMCISSTKYDVSVTNILALICQLYVKCCYLGFIKY